MRSLASQVAFKRRVGSDGIHPVWRIVLKGGLNVITAIRNGQADELALGPHQGVAMFAAKKRCPTIRWNELSKADADAVDPNSPVVQAYERLTDAYRAARR